MAYTPELSIKYSGALRRIAWAFDMPMTQAIEGLFDYVLRFIDRKRVCEACKDRSFCEACVFKDKT